MPTNQDVLNAEVKVKSDPLANAHRPVQETVEAMREAALSQVKTKEAPNAPLIPPKPIDPVMKARVVPRSQADEFIKNCTPEQLRKLERMTEDQFMEDASMVAIPFEMPDLLNVKLLDPMYIPRLVNWKGHGGANYGKMRAIGFIPCVEEDIAPNSLDPEVFKPGTVGRFEYYDVVLMKIHKLKYFAALKANLITSRAVTNRRDDIMKMAVGEANNNLGKEVGRNALSNLAGKVSTFVPSEADAASLNSQI